MGAAEISDGGEAQCGLIWERGVGLLVDSGEDACTTEAYPLLTRLNIMPGGQGVFKWLESIFTEQTQKGTRKMPIN